MGESCLGSPSRARSLCFTRFCCFDRIKGVVVRVGNSRRSNRRRSRLVDVIVLVALSVIVIYELATGKFFGASGRIIKRDEHPFLYASLIVVEIAALATFISLAIHALWLKMIPS